MTTSAIRRLLIENLLRLARDEDMSSPAESLTDHALACLLLASSHSPGNLELASRLAYRETMVERGGERLSVRGLCIHSSGVLLSEVVERLARMDRSPIEGVSLPEYQSGLHALGCILRALERTGSGPPPRPSTAEARAVIIEASRRLVHNNQAWSTEE